MTDIRIWVKRPVFTQYHSSSATKPQKYEMPNRTLISFSWYQKIIFLYQKSNFLISQIRNLLYQKRIFDIKNSIIWCQKIQIFDMKNLVLISKNNFWYTKTIFWYQKIRINVLFGIPYKRVQNEGKVPGSPFQPEKILIKNGRIVNDDEEFDGDVFIEGGKIT